MIANEKKEIGTEPLSFEIVWRNPLALVQAGLRGKEANNPHYGWAEKPERFAHAVLAETPSIGAA